MHLKGGDPGGDPNYYLELSYTLAGKLPVSSRKMAEVMDLRTVREQTGISEKTLRKWIKEGKLEGKLIGSGQHRHWEISEESLNALRQTEYGDLFRQDGRTIPHDGGNIQEDAANEFPHGCDNCEWLKDQLEGSQQQLEEQRKAYEKQLEAKDRQIEAHDQEVHELHILLQQAQEQMTRMLPAPRRRRWWWPF